MFFNREVALALCLVSARLTPIAYVYRRLILRRLHKLMRYGRLESGLAHVPVQSRRVGFGVPLSNPGWFSHLMGTDPDSVPTKSASSGYEDMGAQKVPQFLRMFLFPVDELMAVVDGFVAAVGALQLQATGGELRLVDAVEK